MKYLLAFVVLIFCHNYGYGQNDKIKQEDAINVVVIGAHPDDADIKAGEQPFNLPKWGITYFSCR